MFYLTDPTQIKAAIDKLATAKILWMDVETADWATPNPRLSIIQILADSKDTTGEQVYILDVLDKLDVIDYCIQKIIINPNIEKVFHNASFDIQYLGGKTNAENITCTYRIAQKIPLEILQVPNRQLKTLAAELCNFPNPDKEAQTSDWGKRPLTEKQLQYAKMDTVYLAEVHRRLLEISQELLTNKQTPMPNYQDAQNPSLSPTKIRLAFECPRLFYLHHRFNSKALFIPPENQLTLGNIFHKVAETCIITAKKDPEFKQLFKPNFPAEKIAEKMQDLIYGKIFFPKYLQPAIEKEETEKTLALQHIWQGLNELIRHWAALLIRNRPYCEADVLINRTFVKEELTLESELILPDGSPQKITGKLDSLIFDFEKKRHCVVDYKTYQPVDPSAQLAQVAVYSYMLWNAKTMPVDSAIYSVFPEFKEYHYSWEELEPTFHKIIPDKLQQMQEWLKWEPPHPNPPPATPQPHLCQICSQQTKCQSFFNTTETPPVETPPDIQPPKAEKIPVDEPVKPAEPSPKSEADVIGEKLVTTLKSFGLNVDYLGAIIGPTFIRVRIKPHLGVKVVSILNKSADFQVQMGISARPLMSPQAGYVSIDLPREDRQIAAFNDYIQPQKKPSDAPVKIAIGINLNSQLIEADLSDPNTCHFLVGGTTGSGKSEFLRALLLSLIYRHPPEHLKIALVDPKLVTFPEFKNIPWLYSPTVKDSETAIELMEELVSEMQSRYQKFDKAGCSDLTGYNSKSGNFLPRIVCIFDEYADFMADKATKIPLEQSIKKLGAMARAAGIHLIIATQRPEAKVVTPLIGSNLPGRIALRTASEANSKIILGGSETSSAYLLGKGDLLYQVGGKLQRLQSLFANSIQIP